MPLVIYVSSILVAAAVAAGITGLLCHLRHKHQRRRGINRAFYGRIVDINGAFQGHIYYINDLECPLQSHGILT